MEKFAFYWYTDDEIFRFTEEDFDRKARLFYENGVTCVITFTCAHSRWTLYPYWDKINEAIKKVVDSLHKYNIRVVEHHSASMMYAPRNQEGWDLTEHMFHVRHSDLESWPGVREFISPDNDPLIGGVPRSTLLQIDGSTGKAEHFAYHSTLMCYNNPDYRRIYLEYLDKVCETGIDGIMCDDIQINRNNCTCPHCRKRFKEEWGYDLPDPEQWDAFYGDYDNPAFIAWLRFKADCAKEWHYTYINHYKSRGYNLIRPNYISDIVTSNWSSYTFDNAPELWDFVFQENGTYCIIGPCHTHFILEANHRNAMVRPFGVPSMSMFYPRNASGTYLSWALARVYGQMYLGTCEGFDITTAEKPYREFEKKYEASYSAPRKAADITFYMSLNTRDYIKGGATYMKRLQSRLQGAYITSIQTDMVFPTDDLELMCTMPCIALCDTVMLSDDEIETFKTYLHRGGRILIEGLCGVRCADGSLRDYDVPAALAECGDVIVVPTGEIPLQNAVTVSAWSKERATVSTAPDITQDVAAEMGKTFGAHLRTRRITLSSDCKDLISTFLYNDAAYTVQIYNTYELIPSEPTIVSHDMEYPNFAPGAAPIESPIEVTIERCDNREITSVKLASPEWNGEQAVAFTDDGKYITFTIPANTFSGYLLVICA